MSDAEYLLDTNVLSEPLRPMPDAEVLDRLWENRGRLATASVVWHEMLFGCERLPESERRSEIEAYLHRVVAASVEILPYDERAAAWHASERARLSAIGRTPPFADGQIAAVAHVNDLILVTSNRAGYDGFDGLRIEDWRG